VKYPNALPILASMKKQPGFTIIELMITIAVLGIGLAIGVPGMQQFILDNRLVSQINTLNSALALARSEAVKQNLLTVTCVSTNGSTCANNTAWTKGWIIFADRDGDLTPDLGGGDGCAEDDTDDCILAIEAEMAGANTLTAAVGVPNLIAFNGTGVARCDANKDGTLEDCVIANTYFTLCDHRGAAHARGLAISKTGRTSSIKAKPAGGALVCP
jgi:prepilin-type N-terminal cleavage/methylation domain-containing protein